MLQFSNVAQFLSDAYRYPRKGISNVYLPKPNTLFTFALNLIIYTIKVNRVILFNTINTASVDVFTNNP